MQRCLEGEQDLELRRLKSAEHARAAAEAARKASDGSGGLESRRHAMREIGRALALDPENVGAVSTMVTLLTQPPAHTPPEVAFAIEREFRRDSRWIGRVGAFVYPTTLLFLPLFFLMGVRQPAVLGVFFGLLAVSAGLSVLVMKSRVPPLGSILLSMLTSMVAFGLAARFSSPFLIAPTALAVNATGYAIFLRRQHRLWVTAAACLAFLVPLALELLGAISPTFVFAGGGMTIHPTGLDLPEGPTIAFAAVSMIAALILCTIVVGHIRDRLADAERRLMLYTWHLREFVPSDAHRATDPAD